jgi:hypothetical protein
MFFFVAAPIYIICLIVLIINLIRILFRSKSRGVKQASQLITILFFSYWTVLAVGALMSDHKGQSYKLAGFVAEFLLVISLSIYALLYVILYWINGKFFGSPP